MAYINRNEILFSPKVNITVETPYYDGTVIIEKAQESVLGLRRFKETLSNIDAPTDMTEEGFINFYNNNAITIEPILYVGESYSEEFYGFTPTFEYEGAIYSILYYNNNVDVEDILYLPTAFDQLKQIIPEFTVTSTANTTVDEWLLANTEGVSV